MNTDSEQKPAKETKVQQYELVSVECERRDGSRYAQWVSGPVTVDEALETVRRCFEQHFPNNKVIGVHAGEMKFARKVKK